MKILIIEDDFEIVEVVSLAFQMRWPDVKLISTHLGEKGAELVENERPDAVILDLGLPDINGFEVLKQIRAFSEVPILILTVRGDEPDVVKGLEWGADDYMIKPFRQLELMSRVKALTRRASSFDKETPLVYGRFRFEPATGQLTYNEKKINLTRTESYILQHLMINAGKVVTYSSLAEEVWGQDYPDATDSLRVYIRRLREKVEEDPSNPKIVLNRPGVGYLLNEPD
ncbi:MAG: response regulator transcription factor [Dehalococcoidales bacterium]